MISQLETHLYECCACWRREKFPAGLHTLLNPPRCSRCDCKMIFIKSCLEMSGTQSTVQTSKPVETI